MPEPFKNMFRPETVAQLSALLAHHDAAFDHARFEALACAPLPSLELKARVAHIAAVLREVLPDDYEAALERIIGALPPRRSDAQEIAKGFILWPFCHFIERYGLAHPERSLEAMRELTMRFTSEFAVRPYLLEHTAYTLERLRGWLDDDSLHVRRWISEGTRPRLPWGQRLAPFIADPSPVIALLEDLKDDPEEYVRRSVANNLNDISKDHPDLVASLAAEWLEGSPSTARRRLVRHALRSLLKQGHVDALRALGFNAPKIDVDVFELSGAPVVFGDAISIALTVSSTSKKPQPLMIDYAVLHKKSNGSLSPKVFKWTTRTLAPGETLCLNRDHRFKPITTRRYYPGEHGVEVLINGRAVKKKLFMLEIP